MGSSLVEQLADALGDVAFDHDPDIVDSYRRDHCAVVPAGMPLAVAHPTSTAEVADVLRVASRFGLPVVVRGAGSGLTGAANAADGCIVLSTARMTSVVDLDERDLVMRVQPGAITADVKAAAAARGLFYPPDPASAAYCSIGGNVATNAGGLCCIKYGTTREYVLGMEVVLADGTVETFGRRSVKGVSGLDLTALMVGSEGTLGVITEITLRLVPPPDPPVTAVAYFGRLDDAASAVAALAHARIRPSLLEIMDRASIEAVEAVGSFGLDTTAEALLLAQLDVRGADVGALTDVFVRSGASDVFATDDPADADAFLAARRMVHPALERSGLLLLDDVAVPLSNVGRLIAEAAAISDRYGLRVATFGHAGDGNLHPTIVYDDGQEDVATAAFAAIIESALSLGGTITGEHGVGALKRRFLGREHGVTSMRLQHQIRALFDPDGRFVPWLN
jgi:glycolate oxidase